MRKLNGVSLIISLFLMSVPALAGVGGAGNGGGGEVEFDSIKKELVTWMTARKNEGNLAQKLDLANSGMNLDPEVVFGRFMKAVKDVGIHVKFQDDPIDLKGYSTAEAGRICGNDSKPAHIVCNNVNWDLSSPQIQYAIVLHEFLGVAGIETNEGEYSLYPVSKEILKYVKRSEKFELGSEAGADCPDFSGNYQVETRLLQNCKTEECARDIPQFINTRIVQHGCHDFTLTYNLGARDEFGETIIADGTLQEAHHDVNENSTYVAQFYGAGLKVQFMGITFEDGNGKDPANQHRELERFYWNETFLMNRNGFSEILGWKNGTSRVVPYIRQ